MIVAVRRFGTKRRARKRGDAARAALPLAPGADVDLAPGPEELVARAELLARMHAAVARLPRRERTLIDRHYLHGEPLFQATALLGVSNSRARRLRSQALARLAGQASTWA